MCLEEMLACPKIETAYLFYGEPKRRVEVPISEDLREKVRTLVSEMHGYYERGYTPRVKKAKYCASCSLKDNCLPELPAENRVASYIKNAIEEEFT
jgi:CRISPR-associated exonuclease Cas4